MKIGLMIYISLCYTQNIKSYYKRQKKAKEMDSIELQENFYTKVIIKENLIKDYLEKIKKNKVYREESFLFFLDPRSKDFLYRFWFYKTSTNLLNFSEDEEVEKIMSKIQKVLVQEFKAVLR